MGDGLRCVLDLGRVGDGLHDVLGFMRVGGGRRGVLGVRGLQAVNLDGVHRQVAGSSRREQALVFKFVETGPEPNAVDAA
jgi:hypothetical protein